MAKKVKLKTSKKNTSVTEFVNSIEDDQLRKDSKKLLQLFKKVTGKNPKMWGSSIIGYGEYTYYRANGDEGTFMATGFSPRKSGPTIYIMPGYQDYSDILKNLGKHKLGKSCLYLKNLEAIDLKVLENLIKTGLKDLKKNYATDY
jgi:hypothetical protein